jgi:hypothetical protein
MREPDEPSYFAGVVQPHIPNSPKRMKHSEQRLHDDYDNDTKAVGRRCHGRGGGCRRAGLSPPRGWGGRYAQ